MSVLFWYVIVVLIVYETTNGFVIPVCLSLLRYHPICSPPVKTLAAIFFILNILDQLQRLI
jgi:hypothetical protein